MNLYSLVWSSLDLFFLENYIESKIPTANGGYIIIATNYSASSTTFTAVIAITIAAISISVLLTMLINNFIIVVFIRFFICLVISTLYRVYRYTCMFPIGPTVVCSSAPFVFSSAISFQSYMALGCRFLGMIGGSYLLHL